MIRNVHERRLDSSAEAVGKLLDGLGGEHDQLWPADRWPPLCLDSGLHVGSRGGHGFVRYSVEAYVPATSVTLRFAPGLGLVGTHRLERDGSTLRHVLEGQATGAMQVMWPLVVRWLHDALIEDLLDGAEAALADRPVERRRPSRGVRALRWAMSPPASRSAGTAARVATAGLVAAGAVHAAWGVGLTWPAADAAALARAVVGVATFPSPAACFTVADLLATATGLVEWSRRGQPVGRLAPLRSAGSWRGAAGVGLLYPPPGGVRPPRPSER